MDPIIFIVVSVVLVFAFGQDWSRDINERSRAVLLARELGLEVEGRDGLSGEWRGVRIRQFTSDLGRAPWGGLWATTQAALEPGLPPDLVVTPRRVFAQIAAQFKREARRVGGPLEPRLEIAGEPVEEVRAILREPEVQRRLLDALAGGAHITLRAWQLQVRVPGHHVDHARVWLDRVTGLALALHRASVGRWLAFAEARGLEVLDAGDRIRGQADGRPVEIALIDQPPRITRITVGIDPPLPADTVLAHAGDAVDPIRLGDPVLDERVGARTSDPAALAAAVCTDAVRGPLLEVVHGHRGSRVLSDRVELVAPGRLLDGLEEAVDAAIELASALSAPPGD